MIHKCPAHYLNLLFHSLPLYNQVSSSSTLRALNYKGWEKWNKVRSMWAKAQKGKMWSTRWLELLLILVYHRSSFHYPRLGQGQIHPSEHYTSRSLVRCYRLFGHNAPPSDHTRCEDNAMLMPQRLVCYTNASNSKCYVWNLEASYRCLSRLPFGI